MPTIQPDLSKGVIYAVKGRAYANMAISSARSLKQHCPEIPIDIFTDVEIDEPAFARVILTETIPRFQKIPAIQNSRFEKTLFLDADTFIVADISDVFLVLDQFDIALAHDQYRNFDTTHRPLWKYIPNAFPQMNGGVIAYNNSTNVLEMFKKWERYILESQDNRDQPSLREVLWESDLRIATLPEEYNLMKYDAVARWTELQCAPRIIHHRSLNRRDNENARFDKLEDCIGKPLANQIEKLLKADRQLAETPDTRKIPRATGIPIADVRPIKPSIWAGLVQKMDASLKVIGIKRR